MTELVWDGKYANGKRQEPPRIALPFQTIETVNERGICFLFAVLETLLFSQRDRRLMPFESLRLEFDQSAIINCS